jgi:hypothetical protein
MSFPIFLIVAFSFTKKKIKKIKRKKKLNFYQLYKIIYTSPRDTDTRNTDHSKTRKFFF